METYKAIAFPIIKIWNVFATIVVGYKLTVFRFVLEMG